MSKSAIIADSSPLIALALIEQLELLPRLYPHILAPPAVWQEVTGQGTDLPGAQAVSRCTWLEIQAPVPAKLELRYSPLSRPKSQKINKAIKNRFWQSII